MTCNGWRRSIVARGTLDTLVAGQKQIKIEHVGEDCWKRTLGWAGLGWARLRSAHFSFSDHHVVKCTLDLSLHRRTRDPDVKSP
jgi:hypothetical protein